jgi:hypothetical protein
MLNFLKKGPAAAAENQAKSYAIRGFRKRVTSQQNAGFLHFLHGSRGNTLKRAYLEKRKNLRHTTNAKYCLNNMLKLKRNNIVPLSAGVCGNFFG